MNITFFLDYYLTALHKALEDDDINYGFQVKGPDWYYPQEDLSLYHELMRFEDSHYEEFPLLNMVDLYFDSKSHYFPDVGDVDIDSYRNLIIKEMDNTEFFNHYLKALYKALENDNINYGFLVKSPSWYYPQEDLNLYQDLMRFEDSHYEEFPLLEKVGVYFDSKSHEFPDVGEIDINTSREQIITEMDRIAQKYGISYK